MEYDFSTLCEDQVVKLAKRLEGVNKTFIKEYRLALNIINNTNANDHRSEIICEIEDLLRDQVNKSSILYTETFNKVQRVLRKHL